MELDFAAGPERCSNSGQFLLVHGYVVALNQCWAPKIGFYHICGADPSVLNGTEFADKGEVFAGAWSRIINAIATAHRHGLGVLIGNYI